MEVTDPPTEKGGVRRLLEGHEATTLGTLFNTVNFIPAGMNRIAVTERLNYIDPKLRSVLGGAAPTTTGQLVTVDTQAHAGSLRDGRQDFGDVQHGEKDF